MKQESLFYTLCYNRAFGEEGGGGGGGGVVQDFLPNLSCTFSSTILCIVYNCMLVQSTLYIKLNQCKSIADVS